VQVLAARTEALLRQQVVRAHLLAQQRRDAFDDAIAHAWPSASLYHLKPVMSTRPTAHQRPRCSSARNDSSCSVKRPKFISFVFGSRCDLSVRSATSASK
jgi:hypothetical protein